MEGESLVTDRWWFYAAGEGRETLLGGETTRSDRGQGSENIISTDGDYTRELLLSLEYIRPRQVDYFPRFVPRTRAKIFSRREPARTQLALVREYSSIRLRFL